jgi:hypothetical protein
MPIALNESFFLSSIIEIILKPVKLFPIVLILHNIMVEAIRVTNEYFYQTDLLTCNYYSYLKLNFLHRIKVLLWCEWTIHSFFNFFSGKKQKRKKIANYFSSKQKLSIAFLFLAEDLTGKCLFLLSRAMSLNELKQNLRLTLRSHLSLYHSLSQFLFLSSLFLTLAGFHPNFSCLSVSEHYLFYERTLKIKSWKVLSGKNLWNGMSPKGIKPV